MSARTPIYRDSNNLNVDVALGKYDKAEVWNKFGYNSNIGTSTPEVIASFGGDFQPWDWVNAETLSFVSTSAEDALGGTGTGVILITGVDENWNNTTETLTITGLTPAVTTTVWRGVNRVVAVFTGTANTSVGTITGTRSTGGETAAQLVAGSSVTQQCIFWCARGWYLMGEYLWANAVKTAGGQLPVIEIKGLTYSYVTNTVYEVFRAKIDTSAEEFLNYAPPVPFPIDGRSVLWFTAETNQNNTEARCRFGGLYTHS